MKHLFLDTNVIIDLLASREPFSENAALLFDLAEKNRITIYVSAVSFNTVYYVLRQSLGHAKTISCLNLLRSLVTTVSVTEHVIINAIQSSYPDFEDAIQYFTAMTVPNIEMIVSRDKKGFKKSQLPIFQTDEVLKMLL